MHTTASFYGCKEQKHCQTFMGKLAQIYKCFINIKNINMNFLKLFIWLDVMNLRAVVDGSLVWLQ